MRSAGKVLLAEGCSLLVAKENQKTTSDFDALEPRKRGGLHRKKLKIHACSA